MDLGNRLSLVWLKAKTGLETKSIHIFTTTKYIIATVCKIWKSSPGSTFHIYMNKKKGRLLQIKHDIMSLTNTFIRVKKIRKTATDKYPIMNQTNTFIKERKNRQTATQTSCPAHQHDSQRWCEHKSTKLTVTVSFKWVGRH